MTVVDFPVIVPGLPEADRVVFAELLQVWRTKRRKNLLLGSYYDSHQALKDLGISLPPQLKNVTAALGWPRKAVDALARKHVFEGFSLAGDGDPFEMNELLKRNEFDQELSLAITASYKQSVSLMTVTAGDVASGEPEVMIQARSAESSAMLWDRRRRELKAALAVIQTDDEGNATECVLMLRHATCRMRSKSVGHWGVDVFPNKTGRVLAEPFVYDPQLDRPFGHSRITREVRYLTDAAIRTLLRTEVSAEFFASPQRYLLGADEEAFKDTDKWSAITGRFLALSNNEEGEKPQIGQFSQISMDPHLSMYRQLAQNFCAATNLPQSAVGMFGDNPASAEAMQAAESHLSDEAEYQWRMFAPKLRRTVQSALMIRDKLTEPHPDSWKLNVNWTAARYVSPQAASDWAVKSVGADPLLAGTSVMRRRLGLSQGEIDEVAAESRGARVSELVDQLRGGNAEPTSKPAEDELTQAQVLKVKADAVGVLRRAGVEANDAADRAGLPGLKFIPGQPITIKQADE